tara:strand:+ start:193 stop:714 length:522 start_codon:yes stop_codon:yes gene_type:complete
MSNTDDYNAGNIYRTIKFIMSNPIPFLGNKKIEENTLEYDKEMSSIIRQYVLKERANEIKYKRQQLASEAGPAFIPQEKNLKPKCSHFDKPFSSFGSASGKRSCSHTHTKDISFCHTTKRPRINDNLEDKSPFVHIRREMAQQKKVDREIAKLEANKEEVSKALDRLKNTSKN